MANTIAEAIKEAVTEVITTYTGNNPELTATEARKEDFALAEISSIIGLTGEKLQCLCGVHGKGSSLSAHASFIRGGT